MKCEELLAALNDYVDGEIDPGLCESFEKHLIGCNPCRLVVDSIRHTISLYKGDELYELPLSFRERLHQTLAERWQQKRPSSTPGSTIE